MNEKHLIKKILLINPPSIVKKSWVEGIQTFPLGLASIASVLVKNNYKVEILDCFIENYKRRQSISDDLYRIGMSDDEIIASIKKYNPDLIGVSIQFSIQYLSALHINSLIKEIDENIITVTGGNHVSAAPETIKKNTFDWLIIGEGEFRFLNLINAINTNTTNLLSPEIAYLSDDSHLPDFKNLKIEYIKDLNILPMPSYNLLSLKKYWDMGGGSHWANMFITRGCPYNCVFCSIHTIMGKKVRYKNVDNVIKEVLYLKRELGVNEIFIEDDNLTFNMNWAKDFFRRIIQEKLHLKIHLRNGIRADKVDMELLKLMKKAGVIQLAFAPESGKQETLDNIINKHLKLKDVENSIKMANKVGIYVSCFLVVGFPEETLEDVKETIKYAFKLKKIGSDDVWISCATPYPGTRLFDNCIKYGILSKDNINYQELSTMGTVIHNKWFTAEELKNIRDKAMHKLTSHRKLQVFKLLLSNPFMFIHKIRNIIVRRI
ncbi:MAG: B12-binding domain-containing radical SAM protein [Bacteroidales bacterium]|nr:B12-binding domain-containing radical SAM protein [Bacteroidales bacterium]